MRVTFLGTGSAMPTGRRFQTGLLVEPDTTEPLPGDAGSPLLVDCGSGVIHALARTDVGYEGVETLLLTHHHLDHVSDIPALMKARWLAGEESLTIVGPPGTRELVTGLLDVHDYMQGRLALEIRAVEDGETFELSGMTVEAFETTHSMQCLAYRFEADGPAFVFSGDSEARADLCALADGAAALAHDCSFPDEVNVSNHPTPASLGRALSESGATIGRVYLTHLYPHTEGRHEEMLASLGQHYDGDVEFAHDGLSVDLATGG